MDWDGKGLSGCGSRRLRCKGCRSAVAQGWLGLDRSAARAVGNRVGGERQGRLQRRYIHDLEELLLPGFNQELGAIRERW